MGAVPGAGELRQRAQLRPRWVGHRLSVSRPSANRRGWAARALGLATLLSPDRVIQVVNRQRLMGVHPMLGRCPQLLYAGLPPVRRLPRRCAHRGTSRPRGLRALPKRAACGLVGLRWTGAVGPVSHRCTHGVVLLSATCQVVGKVVASLVANRWVHGARHLSARWQSLGELWAAHSESIGGQLEATCAPAEGLWPRCVRSVARALTTNGGAEGVQRASVTQSVQKPVGACCHNS